MKKVLATLLIATVGLSTLLANGISEGVVSNSSSTDQVVVSSTVASLEVETALTDDSATSIRQGRGFQSTRANMNEGVNSNQGSKMQRPNRSMNDARSENSNRNGAECYNCENTNRANPNRENRDSTARVGSNNQRMNQERLGTDECARFENESNTQRYEQNGNRGFDSNNNQMNGPMNNQMNGPMNNQMNGPMNNQMNGPMNNQMNGQDDARFSRSKGEALSDNERSIKRAENQLQRPDECTNLEGPNPRNLQRGNNPGQQGRQYLGYQDDGLEIVDEATLVEAEVE